MKNGHTFCIISRMKRLRRGFSLLAVMIVSNNRHFGHTRLSKFGRLPAVLKQTEAKVGLSAVYTAQKNIFRNQSNLRRFTQ